MTACSEQAVASFQPTGTPGLVASFQRSWPKGPAFWNANLIVHDVRRGMNDLISHATGAQVAARQSIAFH
jgi:hypothetical protein